MCTRFDKRPVKGITNLCDCLDGQHVKTDIVTIDANQREEEEGMNEEPIKPFPLRLADLGTLAVPRKKLHRSARFPSSLRIRTQPSLIRQFIMEQNNNIKEENAPPPVQNTTSAVGTPSSLSEYPQPSKPRRPHHKSRTGCQNCKVRKVKVSLHQTCRTFSHTAFLGILSCYIVGYT